MIENYVIAVDFDGTVVKHRFPQIGDEVPNSVSVLKALQKAGFKLVLNTMRSDGPKGNFLTDAVTWFRDREIHLYGINCNPNQKSWTSSPKVYAHLYIDDAGFGAPLIYEEGERPFVDWEKVREYFQSTVLDIESIHQ